MIKFPQVHIATSVVNRILNIHEGIEAQRAAAVASRAPAVPDPSLEGANLGAALEQPAPPVTADDATAQQVTLKNLL